MRGTALALVLTSSLALAVPAAAQHVSFSPVIGFYIPTEQLSQIVTGKTGDDFKLEAGPSFGARLGLWFGSRFGVEVGGSYVPTTFQLTGNTEGNIEKKNAKIFLGSAQAVVFLLPRTSFFNLYLSGGLGLVSRAGNAFAGEPKTRNVGGTFGAGAGLRLLGIMLTAGADLMTYNASYVGSTNTTKELKQKDIAIKLGFGFPLGGR